MSITISSNGNNCQYQVYWDAEAGGFRAKVGELVTGAYINLGAAVGAAERGEVAQAKRGEAAQAAPEGEGLVSCQQSLVAPPAPLPETAGNHSAAPGFCSDVDKRLLASGEAPSGEAPSAAPSGGGKPKPFKSIQKFSPRYRITLSDGEKTKTLDSFWSRLSRCNKRVKAWSQSIPRLNRRLRRMYKKLGIGPRLVMVTLTYKEKDAWEPNHIRGFMLNLRKVLKDKLWAYAWVAEMQQRGAIHYHVMLYVAPGTKIPMPDEAMEDGTKLWEHGSTRIETAKRGPFYILKYAGKEYQKEGLPLGARMFAVWIGKKQATAEELLDFRLSSAPPYVQEQIKEYIEKGFIDATVKWKRVKGGGWVIVQLGELLKSIWFLFSIEQVIPPLQTEQTEYG